MIFTDNSLEPQTKKDWPESPLKFDPASEGKDMIVARLVSSPLRLSSFGTHGVPVTVSYIYISNYVQQIRLLFPSVFAERLIKSRRKFLWRRLAFSYCFYLRFALTSIWIAFINSCKSQWREQVKVVRSIVIRFIIMPFPYNYFVVPVLNKSVLTKLVNIPSTYN